MAQKSYRDTQNDGYLEYGIRKTERNERKARIVGEFESMGRLAFKEMSCRESDYLLAKALSASLDLKIRTFYPPNLKNFPKQKLKIILNSTEYDVIKVDDDREKRYLYFYLQEVGSYEHVEGETETTD